MEILNQMYFSPTILVKYIFNYLICFFINFRVFHIYGEGNRDTHWLINFARAT